MAFIGVSLFSCLSGTEGQRVPWPDPTWNASWSTGVLWNGIVCLEGLYWEISLGMAPAWIRTFKLYLHHLADPVAALQVSQAPWNALSSPRLCCLQGRTRAGCWQGSPQPLRASALHSLQCSGHGMPNVWSSCILDLWKITQHSSCSYPVFMESFVEVLREMENRLVFVGLMPPN